MGAYIPGEPKKSTMTDKHPELGTITAEEVELIKKARERKLKSLGWHLGADACRNYIGNLIDARKDVDENGNFKISAQAVLWELTRIRDNPSPHL